MQWGCWQPRWFRAAYLVVAPLDDEAAHEVLVHDGLDLDVFALSRLLHLLRDLELLVLLEPRRTSQYHVLHEPTLLAIPGDRTQ